jgi:hypothetical protein
LNIAEIDKLRKKQASMAKNAEQKSIKRPEGNITNLQKAMGLENDKALYMNCQVSLYFILYKYSESLITMKGDC